MNKRLKHCKRILAAIAAAALLATGCVGTPKGVSVVSDFELERYLGTWYEIARLDHRFERGLTNVSANYAMRDDGGVRVLNRGYDKEDQEWDEAIGKAYFTGESDVGQLKVSFFGPFYGGYNIVELDKDDYQYSLVIGPNLKYLWILSRTPTLAPEITATLVTKAKALGFATDELIYVDQSLSESSSR